MKIIKIAALIIATATSLPGQDICISGTIEDNSGAALPMATVVVLSSIDSSLQGFVLSDDLGQFTVNDIEHNLLTVQVSYLGYEQFSRKLDVSETSGLFDMGKIILQTSSNEIEQVTIEGERTPIKVSKDTITYNADAFKVQPNEAVEDLLKKLPGVEVDNDGTITAQGEEVEQVLVDGKAFFGKDPKIATRNLPADAVEKVEIYDEKSDMTQFTGVDDGEREKTINLQLKADKRRGYFGTVEVSGGTNERFKNKVSVNRFSQGMQLSLLGNWNNINEQGFSVRDYVSFMGGMGGFGGRSNDSGINISQGLSDGFVTTRSGGLNFNYALSDNTEMSLNYFANSISNSITKLTTRENFTEGGTFATINDGFQESESLNHRVNWRLDHRIDSIQDIRFNGSLQFNDGNLYVDNTGTIFGVDQRKENNTNRIYYSNGNDYRISGNTLYRLKLGKHRRQSFTLNASLNETSEEFDALNESTITDFPDDEDLKRTELLLQQQLQKEGENSYKLQSSFVLPFGNREFLEFGFTRQNYNSELIREVYDQLNGNELLTGLGAAYNRDYIYDRFGPTVHFNYENTQLSFEAGFHNSSLKGEILSLGENITTDVFRFVPRISWRQQLGSAAHLRMRYNASVNEPTVEQLQPVVDNTDPQNIYIGNPDLVPEYRHALRANFIHYDQFTFQSIFAFLNASYTRNSITELTIKEEGRQVRQSVNVDYNFNISGTVNYSTPIRALKIKTDLRTTYGYRKTPVFVNGVELLLNRHTVNTRWSIENRKKDIVDWKVGANYGLTNNLYNNEGSNNQKYSNKGLFAETTMYFSDNFSLESEYNVSYFSGDNLTDVDPLPIWTAGISYYFLKDQKGELRLSVFDILNHNKGIDQSASLNYIETSVSNALGRYAILSFVYNLKKGKSQNSGSSGNAPDRFR